MHEKPIEKRYNALQGPKAVGSILGNRFYLFYSIKLPVYL